MREINEIFFLALLIFAIAYGLFILHDSSRRAKNKFGDDEIACQKCQNGDIVWGGLFVVAGIIYTVMLYKCYIIDLIEIVFLAMAVFYCLRLFLINNLWYRLRFMLTLGLVYHFIIDRTDAVLTAITILLFIDLILEYARPKVENAKEENNLLVILVVALYLFYSEHLVQKMKSISELMRKH